MQIDRIDYHFHDLIVVSCVLIVLLQVFGHVFIIDGCYSCGGDNPGGGDTDIRVTEVYVAPFSLTMNPGNTKQLTATITSENATYKSLNL